MRRKKGQISFEFITLVSFMFGFFVILLMVIQDNIIEYQEGKMYTGLEEIGEIIENEVNLATTVEDGYQRSFYMPVRINAMPYNVSILGTPHGAVAYVMYVNRSMTQGYSVKIPVNVRATSINIGDNQILKSDGLVYIN